MGKIRISEFHLEVKDINKSIELYQKLIPHKKVLRWADGRVAAIVLDDGTAFGLWETGTIGIHSGQGGNHTHFAFQIEPEQYDEYKQKITACDLIPKEHLWETGHKSVYFKDYDDHQGEFITTDWITLNNIK